MHLMVAAAIVATPQAAWRLGFSTGPRSLQALSQVNNMVGNLDPTSARPSYSGTWMGGVRQSSEIGSFQAPEQSG